VANTISLIDTQTMTWWPSCPARAARTAWKCWPTASTLLVSSRWARKLSFIDIATGKVVRQVAGGRSPHGVWTLDHAPRQ
jgi:hypothetical protein